MYETEELKKPFFPEGPFFNLSHSGSLAVLAAAPFPVGADTERIAAPRPTVFARVLSGPEEQWMASSPEERFFVLWTRKEAVLKCAGAGITRSMKEIDVLPGHRTELDGTVYWLHTVTHEIASGERYVVSSAGTKETALPWKVLRAEDLLKQEESIWN